MIFICSILLKSWQRIFITLCRVIKVHLCFKKAMKVYIWFYFHFALLFSKYLKVAHLLYIFSPKNDLFIGLNANLGISNVQDEKENTAIFNVCLIFLNIAYVYRYLQNSNQENTLRIVKVIWRSYTHQEVYS